MRGEHLTQSSGVDLPQGPSPRVRGAQVVYMEAPQCMGTIPACAGSTLRARSESQPRRDHPRVRGEHRCTETTASPAPGPSPRARGARPGRRGAAGAGGTIPACAGSTVRVRPRRCGCWDHPRVRGEHARIAHLEHDGGGLSPRARGAPGRSPAQPGRVGTIPACAGSTRYSHTSCALTSGPSPRARGAHAALAEALVCHGTIPACAGSTGPAVVRVTGQRDHPRVRGEHDRIGRNHDVRPGPSPRARGAPVVGFFDHWPVGTIPACAGSTVRPSQPRAPTRDHPRVRGEHAVGAPHTRGRLGPSPRARGAQCERVTVPGRAGTIPACAGSTPDLTARSLRRRDHPRVRGEH